jgi:hypothetical protein
MQGADEDEGVYSFQVLFFDETNFWMNIALEALTALQVTDTPADVFSTPPQLDGELITLTLLPRSRWQTLLNLEVIQVCNLYFTTQIGANRINLAT